MAQYYWNQKKTDIVNPECISNENVDDITEKDLTSDTFKKCVVQSSLSFIGKLYSNYSITRSTVQNIILDINNIFSEPLEILQEKTLPYIPDNEKEEFMNIFQVLLNPFENLNSEYLRLKYLSSSEYFFPVQSLFIGQRRNDKKVNNTIIVDMADCHIQYVPVQQTLKAFLEIPTVYDSIMAYILEVSNEPVISNIMQGQLWAEIKTKFDSKLVLPIFLYMDDFEVGNPLGSHAGVHKIGALYFSLACLPPECSSQLENIFLASFHHSSDLKLFGNRAVFNRVIEDFKYLYKHGLTILVNGVPKTIYFWVCLILGDNLGIHTLMGLTESFSSNHFCRFCRADKAITQKQTLEDSVFLRNATNYENDFNNLTNGVSSECVWNSLPNFHLTQNLCCDIMHDIYEGVCRYDLGQILYKLIFVDKYLTLDMLNNRITFFNFYDNNKPPLILKSHIQKKHLVMSASEMKTLMKYLGLIIGDQVPSFCSYWDVYLLLCDIIDVVESQVVVSEFSGYLQCLIHEHHELYIAHFGDLKPKHHFLIHYPRLLKLIGPLSSVSSIRYEGHHRQFKSAANICSSRKNITYTLAMKNQLVFSCRILANKNLLRHIEYGSENILFSNLSKEYIFFFTSYGQEVAENSFAAKYVKISGTKYYSDQCLMLSFDNDLPLFGKILFILVYKQVDVFFIFGKFETVCLNKHLHAYEVQDTEELFVCKYLELNNIKPVFCHTVSSGKKFMCV